MESAVITWKGHYWEGTVNGAEVCTGRTAQECCTRLETHIRAVGRPLVSHCGGNTWRMTTAGTNRTFYAEGEADALRTASEIMAALP